MTITILPSRNEFTATAGQTVFNYTFKIFASTDLNVFVTPAGQEADDTTDQTTAFSVTNIGDEDGGTMTLVTPASVGDLVTIVSDIPENRTTDYQFNGDFIPDTVNDDFDRVVSLVKQIDEKTNRSLISQESQQGSKPLTLPEPSPGLYLKWKSDQSGMENTGAPGVLVTDTTFNVVSDMIADTSLSIGDIVRTSGYTTMGDAGNNEYQIVAAGTGSDDGGTFIDLDTLQAKGLFPGGIVNVKQYGAVATGGFDSHSAIQASLRAAAGQYVLVIPAESFEISDGLVIPANTTLNAYGATIKVQTGATPTIPLTLNGEDGEDYPARSAFSDIIINGGTWDCNDEINGFAFGQAEDISINDVTVLDVKDGHAVEYNSIKNGTISNIRMYGFLDSAPPARDFSEAIQLDGAYVQAFFPSFGAGSFDGTICENITIDGVICKDWPRIIGSHGYNSAAFDKLANITIANVVGDNITNAVFHPNGWIGATIDNVNVTGVTKDGLSIEDCENITCSDFTMTGVASSSNGVLSIVDVDTSNIDITLNNINVQDFDGDGYDLRNTFRLNVNGGIVRNIVGDGCRLVDCQRVIMDGAVIDNSGTENVQVVHVAPIESHIKLTNLTLTGATTNSIFANNASNIQISGCSISDQDGDGIQLDACPQFNVSNNNIDDTTVIGIFATSNSLEGILHGNTISAATGIHLEAGSDDCIVTSNQLKGSTTAITDAAAGTVTDNNQV